jgi:hypothetical protein
VIAVVSLLGFAVCLTPQVNFDALHYHLAMPLIFLDESAFVERPDIIQSYFPLGLEMVYAPVFRLGGETTANLLHWAFAPMSAALLWSAGDRFFGRPSGAIAAALFALMPLVIWESTAASSDLALVFFLIAGAYAIALYAGAPAGGLALAAGLLTGLALSFKLVAALYVVPLALVFVLALWRTHGAASLLSTTRFALFGLGGLIGGAPWLLLRLVQTGNPVFPLYNDIFRSDKWPPRNERFDLDQFGIGTSPSDFVSFWWEATIDPVRFGQATPAWLIGLPLLLSLAALLLLPRLHRLPKGALLLLVAAAACLLAWFLLSQYHRYGLPAFALLTLPAAFAIIEAFRALTASAATRQLVMTLLIAVWFGAGTTVGFAAFSLVPGHFPTDVLLGRETADEYRERAIPNYEAIRYFDEVTRDTSEAGAILGFPYNYFALSPLYDVIVPAESSAFRRVAESGLSPAGMASALLDADVAWMVYDSTNPFGAEEWPPDWLARSVLSPEFIANHTEVAFESDGVFVYRIVPGPP